MAYTPAVNLTTTSGLTHLASVYYKRNGLNVLRKSLRFLPACWPDELPQRSGKTCQWFRPTTLAANLVASSEGVVGTGVGLATTTVSATVSQYSDFTTVSALLQETAINNMIDMASQEMSYRAALSVDGITRAEIDSAVASVTCAATTTNAVLKDLRKAVYTLKGKDVRPWQGDDFYAVLHPYNLYDIVSDSTAGGFMDLSKYTDKNSALNGEVGRAAECRIVSSTNVGDDGAAATTTKYYMYVFGQQAVGALSLAGRGPSEVQDPDKQTFKLNVIAGGPQIADPEGQIGTAISYRFVYAAKILDTATYRYAIVPSDASLV